MRHEVRAIPLPSPLATGNGTPIDVSELHEKTVQLAGTFVAQVQLGGSLDGTNFHDLLASPLSSGDIVTIPEAVKFIRAQLTYTSGTPILLIAGFNSRTDV